MLAIDPLTLIPGESYILSVEASSEDEFGISNRGEASRMVVVDPVPTFTVSVSDGVEFTTPFVFTANLGACDGCLFQFTLRDTSDSSTWTLSNPTTLTVLRGK